MCGKKPIAVLHNDLFTSQSLTIGSLPVSALVSQWNPLDIHERVRLKTKNTIINYNLKISLKMVQIFLLLQCKNF